MKRLFSISIMAIMFFTLNANAQNSDEVIKPNPKAPQIKFDKLTHDYGTIQQGGNGDCEFKFKNVGKEPLILSNVVASCGCTTPSWPKEPIMPGKSSVIKVHYDTQRLGTISKTITVMSNASNDNVKLSIAGNILAKPTETLPEKPKSTVSN